MQFDIITVGKIKEKYLVQGIQEYVKRMQTHATVNMIEVPDEKAGEQLSPAEALQVKEKEAERILAKVKKDVYVIALAIEGKVCTSEQLAKKIDDLATYGNSHIVFIIGGSLGLSASVLQRANHLLSFGKLTYPHQLMRLMLAEQLYRSIKINRGEPYHK
ncbi:23S rRNA (pseudouridine(1915)-N(3))-methyltransferase RlmH [Longirhabdus pacifica]|uniref:23S rRNA (pseudouridine(1915)-N(3))-methyltransferase RlmH n=1 Tax=Longirhabdus pacifica TaxID=2305227 RepID=UPI001008F394|nr:23S rRNA (pseudouridine(1915)-N(3))-methyltransferase RlmH [Longirhabdus pacifica]